MRHLPCVRIIKITSVALLVMFGASCSFSDKSPSVIVITVESLPFDTILCTDSESYKGIKTVCEEMTRFTHAFTPSVLSQPAVASLLTGEYPIDHGVHHNGDDVLPASTETIAEVAVKKGFKTSFFSGGPPIFRRSGLQQGFEYFDDNLNIQPTRLYKPVQETFQSFLSWLNDEVQDSRFLGFIFLPDLNFTHIPTVDNKQMEREATYRGQLLELDESLEYLFKQLKSQKQWNQNWIFFMGLNGKSLPERSNEISGTNLFHENTRVTLFIKPPDKEKDKKNPWVIDMQVSLADVGQTLFDILGQVPKIQPNPFFEVISLKTKLEIFEKSEVKDRIIPVESGWGYWKDLSPIRYAFQVENYLVINDLPLKVFNTVVDRNQIYPLDKQSVDQNDLIKSVIFAIQSLGLPSWDIYDKELFLEFKPWGGYPFDLIGALQNIEPSELFKEKEEFLSSKLNSISTSDGYEKEKIQKEQIFLKSDFEIQKINFVLGSLWDVERDLIKTSSQSQ